jgi:hypothetical protein
MAAPIPNKASAFFSLPKKKLVVKKLILEIGNAI